MSSRPTASPRAAAIAACALDLERLMQSAPVGHLSQRIGRNLVRQPPQFAFELFDLPRQCGGTAVFVVQALPRLADHRVHGAAFIDHLAHHTGQAFERIGGFHHIDVTAGVVLKAPGLLPQFAEFGQHVLDHRFQCVPRSVALDAKFGLAVPRAAQQLTHRFHAARGQPVLQPRTHRLGLTLGPTAVFGQLGQAVGQLDAQRTELVHQVLPVLQHPVGAAAQAVKLIGQFLCGTRRLQALGGLRDRLGQFAARGVPSRQGLPNGAIETGDDAAPRLGGGVCRSGCGGR